jgi:threonine synthase
LATYNFECPGCGRRYVGSEARHRCECGEPLDITYEKRDAVGRATFDGRMGVGSAVERSGVWRYREMLPEIARESIVSRPEGNTGLYMVGASERGGFRGVGEYCAIEWVGLKHEGENPTGSFKDRGMTVGVSRAVEMESVAVACASTGNTAASLASYASQAGLTCFVFIPEGNVALGKLAQTLAYGAITLQVRGDFDRAMALVQQVSTEIGVYLLNSVNPFRIEGQKTIAYEMLQQLGWNAPDWVIVPAGNLGNTSAIGKALVEAHAAGLIERVPRLAAVQAAGANPFYRGYEHDFTQRFEVAADTVATAIKIGAPVSWTRAVRSIRETKGVVAEVTDQEIMEAKAVVDRAGIGCEPASAASVAGLRKLREAGTIGEGERVVCVLTGNLMKDPEATLAYHLDDTGEVKSLGNRPQVVEDEPEEIMETMASFL